MLLEKLSKVKCEVEPLKKWHMFLFHHPVANKQALTFMLPPFEANKRPICPILPILALSSRIYLYFLYIISSRIVSLIGRVQVTEQQFYIA